MARILRQLSVGKQPKSGVAAEGAIRRWIILVVLGLLALSSSGCMHRRMMIRSDPPGAAVLVDGEEVGFTPMALDFTYYGTREITLVKDGYRTLNVFQKVRTPWYQVFPLDFVTDNFALTKINDRRDFSYRMEPEVLVPTPELLDRANQLRSNALQTEMVVPTGR